MQIIVSILHFPGPLQIEIEYAKLWLYFKIINILFKCEHLSKRITEKGSMVPNINVYRYSVFMQDYTKF